MAVFTKNLRKHIFVHPGDQHNMHNAIKTALLKDKKKYSDSLKGALLDVNKIKVIGERYLIVNGYFSMEVLADFEVFSPTIGMTLEGVINKVNRNHYGCLVMNLFNASLSLPEGSSLVPKEGDACTFVVTQLVVDGELIFMRGRLESLTPVDPIAGLTLNQQEMTEKSNETPTKVKREPDDPVSSSSDTETKSSKGTSAFLKEEISSSKSPKKKKKSRKEKEGARLNGNSFEEEGEDMGDLKQPVPVGIKVEPEDHNPVVGNGEISKSPKKHKKKHKKRDKEDSSELNSSSEFPVSIKQESDLDNSLSNVSDNEKSRKHKKHKRKRESLEQESIMSFTHQHSIDASGDHLHTSQNFNEKDSSLDLSQVEHSPSKHKKKRKSKHSDNDFGHGSTNSLTDIVVKAEPITPSKKVKKSRHKAI